MLEEGLATWFQNWRVPKAASHKGAYATAEKLVAALMPELAEVVKRIREKRNTRIGEMTPDVLCADYPNLNWDISGKLCEPFRDEEAELR